MKKMLLIAASFIVFTTATAQTCPPQENYVEVRGIAKTMIDPNKAEISITLSQADSKGKLSMKELEEQLAKALKEAGVNAAKQLVVTNQTSEAEKRNQAYQFKNYVLTITSAAEAQNVFDAFAANGVNNATITKVWNDNQDAIIEKLKSEAILDAQNTAKTLTGAIGQSIGSAIQITDFSYNNDVVFYDAVPRKVMASANAVESLPTLDFKKIRIERTVSVRFLLNAK